MSTPHSSSKYQLPLDYYKQILEDRSPADRDRLLAFARDAAAERLRTYRLATNGAVRMAGERKAALSGNKRSQSQVDS